MKLAYRSLFYSLVYLFIILHMPTSLAETDDSWTQVFNFQHKLAEQGNVKAQYILGEMYEQGRGVDKNTDTAIAWYQKADTNGHPKAAERIAKIQENLKNEAQAKVRAEADKKHREEERAHQLALQKQHAEEERQKEQKLAKVKAAKAVRHKEEEAKLSPEERTKKIKEAQERAAAIAKQHAQQQQQAANAELKKYRASLKKETPSQPASTASTKYQDPFE